MKRCLSKVQRNLCSNKIKRITLWCAPVLPWKVGFYMYVSVRKTNIDSDQNLPFSTLEEHLTLFHTKDQT